MSEIIVLCFEGTPVAAFPNTDEGCLALLRTLNERGASMKNPRGHTRYVVEVKNQSTLETVPLGIGEGSIPSVDSCKLNGVQK